MAVLPPPVHVAGGIVDDAPHVVRDTVQVAASPLGHLSLAVCFPERVQAVAEPLYHYESVSAGGTGAVALTEFPSPRAQGDQPTGRGYRVSGLLRSWEWNILLIDNIPPSSYHSP